MSFGLFLDVKQAFNTVNHELVTSNLYSYGYRGPFFLFLQSYFSERSQTVSLGSVKSNTVRLQCGVPQGAVLGPPLFILYVNDVYDVIIASGLYQYTDDTLLVANDVRCLSAFPKPKNGAIRLSDWCESNLIQIDSANTQLLCSHDTHRTIPSDCSIILHTSKCSP